MPPDEDEITRPGTPDALRTMREMQVTLTGVLVRLDSICDALDRIELALREVKREAGAARLEAVRASATARDAATQSRFSDKRIDSLVGRVQAVESGQR